MFALVNETHYELYAAEILLVRILTGMTDRLSGRWDTVSLKFIFSYYEYLETIDCFTHNK